MNTEAQIRMRGLTVRDLHSGALDRQEFYSHGLHRNNMIMLTM